MQWLTKHSWKIALTVMALTASIEIAISLHAGSKLWYQDERDYVALSKNLVQLHRFTVDGGESSASRPPGYIWFLAVPELFGASNTSLRLFNASALLLAQLFLFLLARRISSAATAAIAIMLSLAYPVLFYTATVLFPQTLGAALLLCGLWLLLDKEPLTFLKATIAGIIWAALILTVPTFLILALAISLWLFWRRADFRRAFLAFALPVVIFIAAWSARNYAVFHTPGFIATNSGVNLLLGNSENVTADTGSFADISKYTTVGHQMSEPEQNEYYSDAAKQWVMRNPKRAARLYAAKLRHYFSFSDRTEANDPSSALSDGDQSWRKIIMIATYGPLLMLFLARIAFSLRSSLSQEEAFLAGLYFINALFSAIFFTRIRFRLPMDWLLLVIDAGMISAIVAWLSSPRRMVSRRHRRLKRFADAESAALHSARIRLSAGQTLGQQ